MNHMDCFDETFGDRQLQSHPLSYLKHVFFTDEHHMGFVQHEGE